MISRIVVVTAVFALTTGLASAANNNGGNGNGNMPNQGKGKNGATYNIDQNTCAVTITSTKRLKTIVLNDEDGNVLNEWTQISGKTFTDFGIYAASLPQGQLYVNGVKIEDNFTLALEACLMPECRFATEIDNALETQVTSNYDTDTAGRCVVSHTVSDNLYVVVVDDGSLFNADQFGITFAQAFERIICTTGIAPVWWPSSEDNVCPSVALTDGTLDAEEAKSCANLLGCNMFGLTN